MSTARTLDRAARYAPAYTLVRCTECDLTIQVPLVKRGDAQVPAHTICDDCATAVPARERDDGE